MIVLGWMLISPCGSGWFCSSQAGGCRASGEPGTSASCTRASSPGAACALGRGRLVLGGRKAVDPHACSLSPAGLFFPGNVNDGVQNERCGWNLLWHRVLSGKSLLPSMGAVQSEASMPPEAFNFCAGYVCVQKAQPVSAREEQLFCSYPVFNLTPCAISRVL